MYEDLAQINEDAHNNSGFSNEIFSTNNSIMESPPKGKKKVSLLKKLKKRLLKKLKNWSPPGARVEPLT